MASWPGTLTQAAWSLSWLSAEPALHVDFESPLGDFRELFRIAESIGAEAKLSRLFRRKAVELVLENPPDIVVMDVRMPRMDGIEACARICAERGDGGPRVVMLTTFDLDDHVHAALRAGASGFMLKDAPAEQLIEAIYASMHVPRDLAK